METIICDLMETKFGETKCHRSCIKSTETVFDDLLILNAFIVPGRRFHEFYNTIGLLLDHSRTSHFSYESDGFYT